MEFIILKKKISFSEKVGKMNLNYNDSIFYVTAKIAHHSKNLANTISLKCCNLKNKMTSNSISNLINIISPWNNQILFLEYFLFICN